MFIENFLKFGLKHFCYTTKNKQTYLASYCKENHISLNTRDISIKTHAKRTH